MKGKDYFQTYFYAVSIDEDTARKVNYRAISLMNTNAKSSQQNMSKPKPAAH